MLDHFNTLISKSCLISCKFLVNAWASVSSTMGWVSVSHDHTLDTLAVAKFSSNGVQILFSAEFFSNLYCRSME